MMRNFDDIDFYDIQFGDHKLSDFGGYVGSSDGGLKQFSLLPTRSYVTDKPLGSNTTTVFDSSFEPRVIEIPAVFDDISGDKIRRLAQWLDSPNPKKLSFVGDDVYIWACLDSTDFNVQLSSSDNGQISLKYICFDPFYYDLNETQYTLTTVTSGTAYEYTNSGYGDLPPNITISCGGTIKIEILKGDDSVYTTTNITDITAGVKINSETLECTLLSGASHFAHIDNFPMIPQGDFKIRVTGSNMSNLILKYRQRYI